MKPDKPTLCSTKFQMCLSCCFCCVIISLCSILSIIITINYIYISYPTPPHPILSYPIHLSKCQASPTNIKQRHSTKELPLLRLPQSCQSTLYPATGPPLPPSGSSPHARHEGFIMGEDPFEASSQGRPCRRPARKRDQKE